MQKHEVLKRICELVETQEAAIRQHPDRLVEIYYGGRDGFFSKPGNVPEDAELEREELVLIFGFLLSSSFIAAWYHLAGDKSNRDKTTESCTTVIASIGLSLKKVFAQHLEFELKWRKAMKHEGVAPRGGASCLGAVLLLVAAGLSVTAGWRYSVALTVFGAVGFLVSGMMMFLQLDKAGLAPDEWENTA